MMEINHNEMDSVLVSCYNDGSDIYGAEQVSLLQQPVSFRLGAEGGGREEDKWGILGLG